MMVADPNVIPAIEVEDLRRQLDGAKVPYILDVREPHETALCAIAGACNIPLTQLPQRAQELPRDCLVVVHCHHGGRSARATQWLRHQGFEQVVNLTGGIDAWALRVDPNMERY
ncbi:MAG: rhodanese-like domain-containing protein [Alphaproteobacteria bacterium]